MKSIYFHLSILTTSLIYYSQCYMFEHFLFKNDVRVVVNTILLKFSKIEMREVHKEKIWLLRFFYFVNLLKLP